MNSEDIKNIEDHVTQIKHTKSSDIKMLDIWALTNYTEHLLMEYKEMEEEIESWKSGWEQDYRNQDTETLLQVKDNAIELLKQDLESARQEKEGLTKALAKALRNQVTLVKLILTTPNLDNNFRKELEEHVAMTEMLLEGYE